MHAGLEKLEQRKRVKKVIAREYFAKGKPYAHFVPGRDEVCSNSRDVFCNLHYMLLIYKVMAKFPKLFAVSKWGNVGGQSFRAAEVLVKYVLKDLRNRNKKKKGQSEDPDEVDGNEMEGDEGREPPAAEEVKSPALGTLTTRRIVGGTETVKSRPDRNLFGLETGNHTTPARYENQLSRGQSFNTPCTNPGTHTEEVDGLAKRRRLLPNPLQNQDNVNVVFVFEQMAGMPVTPGTMRILIPWRDAPYWEGLHGLYARLQKFYQTNELRFNAYFVPTEDYAAIMGIPAGQFASVVIEDQLSENDITTDAINWSISQHNRFFVHFTGVASNTTA